MGRTLVQWDRQDAGWLKNPDRLERRNAPNTMTDTQVFGLLKQIETMPEYSKEDEVVERLLRLRDSCALAVGWTWFKRGGETLRLQLNQVFPTSISISVILKLEKKSKSYRICPYCKDAKGKDVKNAKASKYCKNCGKEIAGIEPTVFKGAEEKVTKNKSMKWPFAKFIVAWIDEMKRQNVPEEAYLFAPYLSREGRWLWEKHITIQRFDQILQRLDPTISSHFFRYGHAEKLKRLGYSDSKIATIGDWESDRMPRIYFKRKGITTEEQEFAEDIRTI